MTTQRAHALLSASGASKWLKCTPSARLEDTLPDSTSKYAAEGSLAHDLAELKLRHSLIEPGGVTAYNTKLKRLKQDPLWEAEMEKHTTTYVDYVSGIVHSFGGPPYIAAEKRLDYSSYAPEGFGTGDCIVLYGNTLHVIDFKYGQGVPVSAVENSQMKLYALGALNEYSMLYDIDTVKMAIVQPRLDSISEHSLSVADLISWGESTVKPKAQMAHKGEGDFNIGDHCGFCRAKALCRARAEFNTSLEEFEFKLPPLLTNEEIGPLIGRAQQLAKWASAVADYALTALLDGQEIPGYKAVHGRSTRQFSDLDTAFSVLTSNGIEEAMLYERKPLTLAAVEKMLGKTRFKELLDEHIISPPGRPALVPESDKREAISRIGAEDDFDIYYEN